MMTEDNSEWHTHQCEGRRTLSSILHVLATNHLYLQNFVQVLSGLFLRLLYDAHVPIPNCQRLNEYD